MNQVFLISEREEFSRSVSRYLRFKGVLEVHSILPPIPPKDSAANVQWVPQTFRKLAAWLEGRTGQASGDSALSSAIVIIDVPSLGSLDEFDPIDRNKGWPAVVAMLLLSFPEVHWVIVSPYTPAHPLLRKAHFPRTASFLDDFEAILKMHEDGFSPLFDPTGLRNEIRRHLALRTDASYIPLRKHCAAAIDEEENYSYFNAYTAYRFGFRCHVMTSYGMMEEILTGEDGNSIELTFEDIYLNFPDRKKSLSKIEVRDLEFPALPEVPQRVFITSGHKSTDLERETWQQNNDYLKGRTNEGFYSKVMYKPESGVFDVWMRSGLQHKFRESGGKAEGFLWPPGKASATGNTAGTHSAPGRLLLIADLLIKRAGRIMKDAGSVPEAVRGGLLALEAQEYLGHRTPTTSLEAVSLKHQLEVLAECMFYGVEYHLDTKSRFAEIEDEVASIGTWFRSETRQISELNAEIGILSELILSFRNFNQFNEEQSGLSKARHLYRRLWFRRNKTWAWIVYPARWYLDQLLSSMTIFIAALAGWLVLFGFIYSMIAHRRPLDDKVHFMHGFEDAISAFFGMQPPHDLSYFVADNLISGEILVWLSLLLIVLSFVHLGIFVSHLYSVVARR
ncbi:MAG TPA: hypothetical protein VD835_02940 [Pyrinomonadaceae bacterium]|nr:hypothetical protein [Pyrinomonadaceae bacterium]